MSRNYLKVTVDQLLAFAKEKLQGRTLRTLYPDSWKRFTIEVTETNVVYTDVETGNRYPYSRAEIEQFCDDVNRVCSLMPKPDLYSQSEHHFITMRSCTLAIIVMYLADRSSSSA